MTTKTEIGRKGEELALKWFLNQGATVLEQNFRSPHGEIDCILEWDGWLVFVEVRFRRAGSLISPEESLSLLKRTRIRKTALHWLYQTRRYSHLPMRFDFLAIEGESIRHYQDAFE